MLATGPTELEWIKIGKEKLTKIKNFGFLDRRLVEDQKAIWPTIFDRSVDPWS